MLRLSVILFILTISAPSYSANSDKVNQCKNSLISAADTIQNISNKVPDKAFGRFIKNGNGLQLMSHLAKLGGGLTKAEAGGKILFSQAKPIMLKNRSVISSAAKACQSPCRSLGELEKKCTKVNELSGYLNSITIELGKTVAWTVRGMRGTNGFKKSIQRTKIKKVKKVNYQKVEKDIDNQTIEI